MSNADGGTPRIRLVEMGTPRTHDNFDFVVHGRAELPSEGVTVDFRANHVDGSRLTLTALAFDAPDAPAEISKRLLRDFPMVELHGLIRAWVFTDGEPSDISAQLDRRDGLDSSDYQWWRSERSRIIALLASSSDGPTAGRKRTRDDAYLRELAERYIALAASGSPHPRADVADAYGKSEAGIATDLAMARSAGWLARPATRGARREIAPGPRLIAARDEERSTKRKGRQS